VGSRRGGTKAAAKRIGMSQRDYDSKRAAGFKWCYRGKHWILTGEFGSDVTRADGLATICCECRAYQHKARYVPRPSQPRPQGRRYVAARDGDKIQARGRVNHLVRVKVIPDPDDLPCVDCGDGAGGATRHSYDHHLGYAADHHESIEPVCYKCHDARSRRRGEIKMNIRDKEGEFLHG